MIFPRLIMEIHGVDILQSYHDIGTSQQDDVRRKLEPNIRSKTKILKMEENAQESSRRIY